MMAAAACHTVMTESQYSSMTQTQSLAYIGVQCAHASERGTDDENALALP